MTKIPVGDKEISIEYTFNSFKFMQDFDVTAMSEVENKPFKVIGILSSLLTGGLNSNPKRLVATDIVDMYTEQIIQSGLAVDVIEECFTELQESDFFKSLQA